MIRLLTILFQFAVLAITGAIRETSRGGGGGGGLSRTRFGVSSAKTLV